jgi:transposase
MPKIQPPANHALDDDRLPAWVVGGVDTHADTHTVAALDPLGRCLGHAVFPVSRAGYADLGRWLTAHGPVRAVGVEGTGSYGAGLTRWLTSHDLPVVEVNRPNRAVRRTRGKSDPIDAQNAATAVLARTATATPKTRTGVVESIRIIHTTRAGAVKACTAAKATFVNLIRVSPDPIHDALHGLTRTQQLKIARGYRPTTDHDPEHTTKHCLRRLAVRIQHLQDEITTATSELRELTATVAPTFLARPGTGPVTVAQLLITIGDNPDRIHSEPAFAALCGTSPVLASSGRTHHHRLNRGGDRQANKALHTIALSRLRYDEPTHAYIAARTTGKATPALIRQLKRSIAREAYHHLIQHLTPETPRSDEGAPEDLVDHPQGAHTAAAPPSLPTPPARRSGQDGAPAARVLCGRGRTILTTPSTGRQ